MEGTYPVMEQGKKVGTVALKRCGLYLELHCLCSPQQQQMLHLILQQNHQREDLGLLIPTGNEFELWRRIPAKRLHEGMPEFYLRIRQKDGVPFYAIDPLHPCPVLHQLDHAVFAIEKGQKGICLLPENYGEKR